MRAKKIIFARLIYICPTTVTMNIHHTRGVVLRSVKYGETSLIVSVFTELFGQQSYLVNGVRSLSKKSGARGNPFQPAALLDLIVYHHDQRSLQRVKEYRWATLYNHIYRDIFKSSVATFMVELLQKCLKQPEENHPLFAFTEEALLALDKASAPVVANFPLFFSLHLANFFGFRIPDTYQHNNRILDLREGVFAPAPPDHPLYLDAEHSELIAQLLRVMQPEELLEIPLNGATRRYLLHSVESYYATQLPEFGQLRSLQVLQDVL
ncbi:MAG: DNA repair protein RecO [Flavihumibacter sp.]